MKKILVLFVLAVSLFSAEIKWEKTICDAVKRAQKEHKPIMFVVSRHSCKYCVMLENTTFKDKKFVDKINKNFIAVIAFSDDGDYIPGNLYSNGTPASWFLYKNGFSMYDGPATGAIPTKDFLKILDEVQKRYKELEKKGL